MPESRLPAQTRVLVIGGGPVGLVVSALLSQQRVANVVIERRSDAQRAPAAHVLRRRTMEILDGLGVGDDVRRTAPALPLDWITWCTTLGGSEIGRLDLRPPHPDTGERPPEPWTNCPQNRLEPILLDAARRSPVARVVRGAECLGLESSHRTVVARIRCADGTEHEIEAEYAVAADGAGSPTRRALGIPMEGVGPLGRFAMVHFQSDLRRWIEGRPGPIFWLMNPESPGTLIVHDPARSHVFMMPVREGAPNEDEVRCRLDAALGLSLAPKILSVDEWSPHVQVAARYREGRIFLVGDSAHRFPPTGGLGLNTGIPEAYELVARLAPVMAGGSPELLDRYEADCRPAARANADESFENMKRLGEISRALGDWPDLASLERRLESLDDRERRRLADAIAVQRSHFLSDGHSPRRSA